MDRGEGKKQLNKLKEKLNSGSGIRAKRSEMHQMGTEVQTLIERRNGKNKQIIVLTEDPCPHFSPALKTDCFFKGSHQDHSC